MAASSSSRFASISPEERDTILQGRISINTSKATKTWIKCLQDYLDDKNDGPRKLSDVTDEELPDLLINFYSELRTETGDKYKTTSLKCIRAGVNRYMKETRNIDILADPRFVRTNELFKGVTRNNKREGKGFVRHHPPLADEDLGKLNEYFLGGVREYPPNATKLQQFVQFNLMFYLCRRGRENLRTMTKSTFQVARDPSGREYVFQDVDEMDKNHTESDSDNTNEAKMYAKPDSVSCPVAAFKLYISKLNPNREDLWQRPKIRVRKEDTDWYCDSPVGKETLGTFMSTLSKDANLSARYTNHCIRATCITVLDRAGFEARHIMTVSSHKQESTIKTYASKTPESKKREMSIALNSALSNTAVPPEKMLKSTENVTPVTEPINSVSNSIDFETIDMSELLSLTDDQEADLYRDMFPSDKVTKPCSNVNTAGIVKQAVNILPDDKLSKPDSSVNPANIVNQALNNMNSQQFAVPRLFFPNSNVTINFNLV